MTLTRQHGYEDRPPTTLPALPGHSAGNAKTLTNLSHTQCITLLEDFCSVTNIPPPRYQDRTCGGDRYSSQVSFGFVDNAFGKHTMKSKSRQETQGEAARRALMWISKLGMLPRNGVEHGLPEHSSSHDDSRRTGLGTYPSYHSSMAAGSPNHGMVGATGLYPSSLRTSPATNGRKAPQVPRFDTSFDIQRTIQKASSPATGSDVTYGARARHEQAQSHPKLTGKSKGDLVTEGPTSCAANKIPLKRRRLADLTPTAKQPLAPVLTKQGLQSRLALQERHVDRVAALCDYLSIARPEYNVVEESPAGACFAAKFPATEILLNRVRTIGLTTPIIDRELGKEVCAGNLEAFLMIQVENGTFGLQEKEASDKRSSVWQGTATEEVAERTKRLRVDNSAIRSPGIVDQSSAKISDPPAVVVDRRCSPTEARQRIPAETESLIINAKSDPSSPTCNAQHDESTFIIKREDLGQQTCLCIDEDDAFEPVTMKQEHVVYIERYEETEPFLTKQEPFLTKQEPHEYQLAVDDNEAKPIDLLKLPGLRANEKRTEVRRQSLKAEENLVVQVHEESNVTISKRLGELDGQITCESANLAQGHRNLIKDEDIDDLVNEYAVDRADEPNLKTAAAWKRLGQMVTEAGNNVQAIIQQELEELEMSY